MLLHRILVIIAIFGIMESAIAGLAHMHVHMPRENYNDDEFHTIMDKLTNELIDDEGDADHYRRERVETKETKPLNDDNATTIDDTVFDMMYLEPQRPSNETHVITSSYGTVEIPVSQNPVVQKVQPQTTINPILSSTIIPTTDKVETEDNETTTTTTSTSTSTSTTSAPLIETTVSTNSTTVETTTTSSCPETVTQEAESIESPPELPNKPNVKTEQPYSSILIGIINGMRCHFRDCHDVLIPTEAYPTEELPSVPMTRFIRGESDNVIPPCPCNRRRQSIDMETGTLRF